MLFPPHSVLLVLVVASLPSLLKSSTLECLNGNLTNCISSSLSQVVNAALTSDNSVNFSSPLSSGGIEMTDAAVSSSNSPMAYTINECAKILQDRLTSFQQFNTKSDLVWNDVSATQTALVGVEEAAQEILATESEFAAKLGQISVLMKNATDRSAALAQWVDGEKVIRGQLTDLFSDIDATVMDTSDDVLTTVSSIRDALNKMQEVHDHATKVLTTVGAAETKTFEWAFNVSQKVNSHTVSLVAIAQTLQYRSAQVASLADANVKLNWVATQLKQKYGSEALMELSQKYDAGESAGAQNVTTASGSGQTAF